MRRMLMTSAVLILLCGCREAQLEQLRAETQRNEQIGLARNAVNALPEADKLECQMQAQMAFGARGSQVMDTCLRMKIARAREERMKGYKPSTDKSKVDVCDPSITNPYLIAECEAQPR